jgi:hypothetical protein
MAYFSPVEMARLLLVRPDIVAKVHATMQQFENETGFHTYVISGYRTKAEQEETYVDSIKEGFRAAPSDSSYHPLGAAVDLGIVSHVRDAATDQKDPLYKRLAEIAQSQGLDSGYFFHGTKPDPYHLQAREPLSQAKATWESLARGRLHAGLTLVAIVVVIIVLYSLSRKK